MVRIAQVCVGMAAAASVVVVAGCGGSGGDSADRDVVIDASVTRSSPKVIDIDGLSVSLYYEASNLLTPVGEHRPVVHWEITNTEPSTPKSFRANLEVRQGEKPIDVFIGYQGDIDAKNEWIVSNISGTTSSGLTPELTGPQRDHSWQYLTSTTGEDFVFTLSDLTVSTTPLTPATPVGVPAPTFDATPDGAFNKLALERGWVVPDTFVSPAGSPDYISDPVLRPAAAMHSFIRQINNWGSGGYANASPTAMFAEWITKWDQEMLATGIELLGDDQIKATYQRVKNGDIDRWFSNGTWVIGDGPKQIPPGTYRVTAAPGKLITDGYWERTSKSGDIIANNFVSSAQEVTVTISPTDGQFTSKRMGTWKPAH
ncbi:hypothetical protein GS896_25800 [Rhodococcus hoagii]|nr:hypothetical protein [Prescottella equi]MBM4654079.1 hypothetical protein [Prescottella equi]MBM4719553.1 hypothetical protein [Prescottella equi]NKR23352.1 hypothetical protein [Prescottella equi]NKT56037.1 hypothetical protein [Prescottella equi]